MTISHVIPDKLAGSASAPAVSKDPKSMTTGFCRLAAGLANLVRSRPYLDMASRLSLSGRPKTEPDAARNNELLNCCAVVRTNTGRALASTVRLVLQLKAQPAAVATIAVNEKIRENAP
jgi:hypothetical protein